MPVAVLVIIGLSVCAYGVLIVRLCMRPMAFCLTFDDGLRVHHDIVAPLLEEYGWRGTFNIPTHFMDADACSLSEKQCCDCGVKGVRGEFMSWTDVRDLLNRGHEAYPHTCDHSDLADLFRAGNLNEMQRQIADAKEAFVSRTKQTPLFFALPHNKATREVVDEIRRLGMEPVSIGRYNFGGRGDCPDYGYRSITDFLTKCYNGGIYHVDIMVHGITAATGGWRPFDSEEAFRSFLNEIKELESKGVVSVVGYAKSHIRKNDPFHAILNVNEWIVRKSRLFFFRFLKKHVRGTQ